MKVNVPASAPMVPPETGASMNVPRLALETAVPTVFEEAGSIVLQSMKIRLEIVGEERIPVSGVK